MLGPEAINRQSLVNIHSILRGQRAAAGMGREAVLTALTRQQFKCCNHWQDGMSVCNEAR